MFLGKVTVEGEVDLDEWSEVHLVTTAAVDWLTVHCVAAAGDWLAVRWLTGEGDWLEVRWVAKEGAWFEVHQVAAAEFDSSWPKSSVSSSIWVDKVWIYTSGNASELLWSPISSVLMILIKFTNSSSATNSVSESFITSSVSPSS